MTKVQDVINESVAKMREARSYSYIEMCELKEGLEGALVSMEVSADHQRERAEKAERERDEVRALLRKGQYYNSGCQRHCFECGGTERYGCKTDCRLAKLLKETETP